MDPLIDIDHPLVQSTVARLAKGATTPRERLERLFYFVRDEIEFGFPPEGDFVKASTTLERGYGQCNTKGTLFLTLCRAVGLEARLHFSDISKEIQRGFFVGLAYRLMPPRISHSWLEVKLDDEWHRIDTYINDLPLHRAATQELERRGWKTGFSVSRGSSEASADLVLDDAHFSQMAAVTDDRGIWCEPSSFFASPDYFNRVGPVRALVYRLTRPVINWRVRRLRQKADTPTPAGVRPTKPQPA